MSGKASRIPSDGIKNAAAPDAAGTDELSRLRAERDALRAELEEVRSNSVLAAGLENISEAIVIYDGEGRLVACNRNFRDLYGYGPDEARPGVHFADLGRIDIERGNVAVGDEYGGGDAYLARKAEYRRRLTGSFTVHLKDGRWIRTNDRPMPGGGFVSVQSDITEIKKNEAALSRAKEAAEASVQLKSEFLASVSHDLRTPLNAIVGFSEMVQNEVFGALENERYRDYVEIINNSGQQLLSIVNAILDVGKLESGTASFDDERFDPVAFTDDLIRGFDHIAATRGVDLSVASLPGVPANIVADRRSTMQILNNLIANACRHVDDGGRVAVTWGTCSQGFLLLEVADNGCGMPEDIVRRVGEPFLSSDAYVAERPGRGAGLGLYICSKLVAARNGKLEIDSASGVGTTVRVGWPLDALYPSYLD